MNRKETIEAIIKRVKALDPLPVYDERGLERLACWAFDEISANVETAAEAVLEAQEAFDEKMDSWDRLA